jgi:hypothetical protein
MLALLPSDDLFPQVGPQIAEGRVGQPYLKYVVQPRSIRLSWCSRSSSCRFVFCRKIVFTLAMTATSAFLAG